MLLTKRQQYAVDDLELIGWQTSGMGFKDDVPGYSCWTYFDADDRYRGADKEGVEPLMQHAPERT